MSLDLKIDTPIDTSFSIANGPGTAGDGGAIAINNHGNITFNASASALSFSQVLGVGGGTAGNGGAISINAIGNINAANSGGATSI